MTRHERPFRLSVTGIDGSGKDIVTRSLLEMATLDGETAVEIGKPSYYYRQGRGRRIFRSATGPIDAVHNYADAHDNKRLILGASATNILAKSRLLEPLAELYRPDIIASNRDARLDAAVYLEIYGKEKHKSMPIEERIVRLQRLTKISRDLIIRLAVDPEIAVARIEQQFAESNGRSIRQPHETIEDLALLASTYETAGEALMYADPYCSVTIETSDRTPEEVTEVAYSVLAAARNQQIRSGEIITL